MRADQLSKARYRLCDCACANSGELQSCFLSIVLCSNVIPATIVKFAWYFHRTLLPSAGTTSRGRKRAAPPGMECGFITRWSCQGRAVTTGSAKQ